MLKQSRPFEENMVCLEHIHVSSNRQNSLQSPLQPTIQHRAVLYKQHSGTTNTQHEYLSVLPSILPSTPTTSDDIKRPASITDKLVRLGSLQPIRRQMNVSTEKTDAQMQNRNIRKTFLNSMKAGWTLIPAYAVWYPTHKAQNQKGTEIFKCLFP